MSTKRIEYVDALRGFTMYLVVYAHVVNFSFHMGDVASFNNILSNFFLSLFFFISGFFAFKIETELKWRKTIVYLRNKAVQLLIPTLVFGTLLRSIRTSKGGILVYIPVISVFSILYFNTKMFQPKNTQQTV